MLIGTQNNLLQAQAPKAPDKKSQIIDSLFMTDKLDWSDPKDSVLALGRVLLCASPVLGTGLNLTGALGFEEKSTRQGMMGAFVSNITGWGLISAGHPIVGAGVVGIAGVLGAREMINSGR